MTGAGGGGDLREQAAELLIACDHSLAGLHLGRVWVLQQAERNPDGPLAHGVTLITNALQAARAQALRDGCAALTAAVSLLRKLEWEEDICPTCYGWPTAGHAADCEMAAVLQMAEAVQAPPPGGAAPGAGEGGGCDGG